VIEKDGEFRAMKVAHRALLTLGVEARRRVVRYLVERHVTSTEAEPAGAAPVDDRQMRLSEAESVAEAHRQLTEARA
jgi:hypothetical protein